MLRSDRVDADNPLLEQVQLALHDFAVGEKLVPVCLAFVGFVADLLNIRLQFRVSILELFNGFCVLVFAYFDYAH